MKHIILKRLYIYIWWRSLEDYSLLRDILTVSAVWFVSLVKYTVASSPNDCCTTPYLNENNSQRIKLWNLHTWCECTVRCDMCQKEATANSTGSISFAFSYDFLEFGFIQHLRSHHSVEIYHQIYALTLCITACFLISLKSFSKN